MRRFVLRRTEDVSGVSGLGDVAEGILFSDGAVAIRWGGRHRSTVAWSSIEDVIAVNGHEGRTQVVWLDPEEGLAAA